MFEVGKRYLATDGENSVKLLCVKRVKSKATFVMGKGDAEEHFDSKSKFTVKVTALDVFDSYGHRREFVGRISSKPFGRDWCVTDKEAVCRFLDRRK